MLCLTRTLAITVVVTLCTFLLRPLNAVAAGPRDKGANTNCSTPLTTRTYPSSSLNRFTFGMIKDMRSKLVAKNSLISGLVTAKALDLLIPAAKGNTLQQMQQTLGIDPAVSAQQYAELWQDFIADVTDDKDPDVSIAITSSLWVNESLGTPLAPAFVEHNRAAHGVNGSLPVETLPFSAPSTIPRINSWVSDATKGMVKDLIKGIDPNAVMMAISALYANMKWSLSFDESLTKEAPFTSSDGTTSPANMMTWQGPQKIPYAHTDNAQLASLPYGKSKRFVMDVLLPMPGFTLDSVLSTLTLDSYEAALKNMYPRDVDVVFPRFDTTDRHEDIKEAVERMGMSDLVTPGKADLSGMFSSRTGDLYVGSIISQGRARATEKGFEMAVTSVVETFAESISFTQPLHADHAFAYFIRDTRTGVILGVGTIDRPGLVAGGDRDSDGDSGHSNAANKNTGGAPTATPSIPPTVPAATPTHTGTTDAERRAKLEYIASLMRRTSAAAAATTPPANSGMAGTASQRYGYPDYLRPEDEVAITASLKFPFAPTNDFNYKLQLEVIDKVITATLDHGYEDRAQIYGLTVSEYAKRVQSLKVELTLQSGFNSRYRVTFNVDLSDKISGLVVPYVYDTDYLPAHAPSPIRVHQR